jgi:hypothetical protein
MCFAGCFRLRASLLCWFSCLSLHVSAYMAIFMCVGYFIFICLKDSASLLFCLFLYLFLPFFTWPHCTFPFVFFVCCFPSLFLLSSCVCVCLRGNNKNNEGKQHTKNTNGNVQSVTTWKKAKKKKKQRSRILQSNEYKISYALEDGHVGRNM